MRNLDTIETLETFVVLARLNSVGKTAVFLHLKHPLESSLSETKTAAS